MKNWPFTLGALIFAITFAVDLFAYVGGSWVLGVLMAIGTVLVFASGVIWLIYHDDRRPHFHRGWVIVPLTIFGLGLFKALQRGEIELLPSSENIETVKNIFAARLQIGVWLVSILLFACFVMAGSLMRRKKA